MDDEMRRALEEDGKKLRELTGEDHGPWTLEKLKLEAAREADRGPGQREDSREAGLAASAAWLDEGHNWTARPVSEGMEHEVEYTHDVLDHGFVRVKDYMGNDEAIVQAARVSYGSGTKSTREDRGLIRYLMRHYHTTPFEMCEIKLHVKLPIFVARQWVRHRTANINEVSARYSILDREFYIPNIEDVGYQSVTNKQGRELREKYPEAAHELLVDFCKDLRISSEKAFDAYEVYGREENYGGIARELNRMQLPLNTYTQWYWKTDLHNLFHFLGLRGDPHAQKEIRDYAKVIEGIVERWVPDAYEAWVDYQRDAVTFSKQEMEIIRAGFEGNPDFTPMLEKMSKREREEFNSKLGGAE